MKKHISLISLLLLCATLTGCTKTYSGIDALTEKAREELPVADADTTALQYAGMNVAGNEALVWFISGDEFQAHTYLPMEVTLKGADRYTFVQTYKPLDEPKDIAVLSWKRGLSFVINNTACTSVKLTTANGTQEENIEDNAYPYVFYCPEIPSEYVFLDADRNEL